MRFRLTTPTTDFYVDIAIRNFDGRWLAVADIAGDREIGLGGSARQALGASLSSLGSGAAGAFLRIRSSSE